MTQKVTFGEGRRLFGLNPEGYDNVRPAYPEEHFSILIDRQVLREGIAALDIGAGSCLATRALIAHGVDPVVVIEPDERFLPLLAALKTKSGTPITLVNQALEDAEIEPASFDLVTAATSFHWLDPSQRVSAIANALKPSGYVALMWNVFQDQNKLDPFHEATKHLLIPLGDTPSDALESTPFALQREARIAEFLATGFFEEICYHEVHWALTLSPKRVADLYESFSHIQKLAPNERRKLLDQLVRIAKVEFGGVVERHMTSPLYLFRL